MSCCTNSFDVVVEKKVEGRHSKLESLSNGQNYYIQSMKNEKLYYIAI